LRLEDDEELQNALQNFRENAEEIPVEDILDFTPNQKTPAASHNTSSHILRSVTSQSDKKTRLKKMNLEQAQIFHFIKH